MRKQYDGRDHQEALRPVAAASKQADTPLSPAAFGLAPFSSRKDALCSFPAPIAHSSGVPELDCGSADAPCSSRSSMHSTDPANSKKYNYDDRQK